MNKINEFTQPSEKSSQVDGMIFLFVCLVLVGVFGFLFRICYQYTRKFPSKDETEQIHGLNRRCISIKGTGGAARYSVA